VLASYVDLNTKLGKRPEVLDDFVAFGLVHSDAAANRAAQVEMATTVEEMYELLKAYDVKAGLNTLPLSFSAHLLTHA
jgi:hypothetical protein